MTVQPASARIASLDQFRGFAVLAMFVVNFLGHLAVTPALLKHNNTYFSLADWIMPGFLFACGFSFRLVSVRRRDSDGRSGAARRYLSRSLGLILLSVMLFGFGSDFTSASEMTGDNIRRFLSGWIKAGLWEVLAIIGAVQILILPVIDAGGRVRTAALAGLAVVHCLLSWSFNYEFVYGRPAWMDAYFGGAGKRCWDGGFFGLISWTEVMLIGTLACDVWKADRLGATLVKLTGWSGLLMAAGYGLSCLTRLYDIDVSAGPDAVAESRSASPVLPQFARMRVEIGVQIGPTSARKSDPPGW